MSLEQATFPRGQGPSDPILHEARERSHALKADELARPIRRYRRGYPHAEQESTAAEEGSCCYERGHALHLGEEGRSGRADQLVQQVHFLRDGYYAEAGVGPVGDSMRRSSSDG